MAKTIPASQAAALSRPQKLTDNNGTVLTPEPVSEAAKAKQIRVRNAVPILTFRYLKNRFITLKDVETPIIPTRIIEAHTTHGIATVPEFDLSKLHKVKLRDENPRVMKKIPGMQDSHYDKIVNQAEQTAVANRLWNDMLRYELSNYVEDGTIEIVEDPFDGREVTESDYEGAVAVHRPQLPN